MQLTATEKKLFKELMDQFGDMLGNAGCNDFKMENTPETRAIFNEIESEHGKDAMTAKDDGKPIYTADFCVLGYLVKKILKD